MEWLEDWISDNRDEMIGLYLEDEELGAEYLESGGDYLEGWLATRAAEIDDFARGVALEELERREDYEWIFDREACEKALFGLMAGLPALVELEFSGVYCRVRRTNLRVVKESGKERGERASQAGDSTLKEDDTDPLPRARARGRPGAQPYSFIKYVTLHRCCEFPSALPFDISIPKLPNLPLPEQT